MFSVPGTTKTQLFYCQTHHTSETDRKVWSRGGGAGGGGGYLPWFWYRCAAGVLGPHPIHILGEVKNIPIHIHFFFFKFYPFIYTTQKKFRITYYIIFVHTILNSHSYAWRKRNCMKLSRLHQWACESTSTNFQDDLTASLENPKNRIFPKILR